MNSAPDNSRKALGKGLSALLSSNRASIGTAPVPSQAELRALDVVIDEIDPNPLQPRNVFQADRLSELAQSIRENGVIQPLIVRRTGSRYQLVAGERRWRAARMAGVKTVPVFVQDLADDRMLAVALVENIQREDLNPIEMAQALERLGRELGLNHEQIGQRTGKDRSTITNLVRLLKLPADVQILLAEHRVSMGHARAILGLQDAEHQVDLAKRVAAEGLSVRQVERLVQRMTQTREEEGVEAAVKRDPNVKAAADKLTELLGTKVKIVEKSEQRGRIEIEYYSMEELSRIFDLITAGCEKSV